MNRAVGREHAEVKIEVLIWLNAVIAVAMATSVFTGQLKVSIENPWIPLVFPASNIFFALFTIAIVQMTLMFPGESAQLEKFAEGGWRVLMGSAIAYFAAQLWDVWVFHWIKRRITGEAHLWLRNIVSTISSQFINTCLFITIVFGPKTLWVMLPGSIAIKFIIALLDTPLVYLARHGVRRRLGLI